MYLCDECGARLVKQKLHPGLFQLYGNNIPFSDCHCMKCSKSSVCMFYPQATREKLDLIVDKVNQIIDWEAKGNVVRFYLGENGNQSGSNWLKLAFEHNAGRVYHEYIHGFRDLAFPFDVNVIDASWCYSNSPFSKKSFVTRDVPFMLVIPKEIWDDNMIFSVSHNYGDLCKPEGVFKIYFGDDIANVEKVVRKSERYNFV